MQCLIEYRREHQQSLAQIATLLEISRSHVHGLEIGRVKPSVDLVRRIHEKTAIPLKRLIYDCTESA